MSRIKTLINGSVQRRSFRLRYDAYWGICFGFIIKSDNVDVELYLVLPFMALMLELEKKPSNAVRI
jgi:hypothetical protein